MSFLNRPFTPTDPTKNNAVGRCELLVSALQSLTQAAIDAKIEVTRETRRRQDAEDRLADVQKLLWMWVFGEWPSGHIHGTIEYFGAEEGHIPHDRGAASGIVAANKARIDELARVLAEDISPENVALERFKREQTMKAPGYEIPPLAVDAKHNAETGNMDITVRGTLPKGMAEGSWYACCSWCGQSFSRDSDEGLKAFMLAHWSVCEHRPKPGSLDEG